VRDRGQWVSDLVCDVGRQAPEGCELHLPGLVLEFRDVLEVNDGESVAGHARFDKPCLHERARVAEREGRRGPPSPLAPLRERPPELRGIRVDLIKLWSHATEELVDARIVASHEAVRI